MLARRIAQNTWAHRSVQSLFRETCNANPDKPAIVHDGQTITFAQLLDRVDRLTHALIRAGVGKGDVVATLPAPTPEFAVAFFAALQAGAIVNPLNLMWERDVLAAVMRRNAPRVLVTVGTYNRRDYLELLLQCFGAAASGNATPTTPRPAQVLVADDAAALPEGFTRIADFVAASGAPDLAAIEARVRDFDPRARQFICQTSGSTGLPKSALWNHRSPLSTAHFLAVNLGLTGDDRWINLSPFFHNSGICVGLVMCLAYGGNTLYLSDRFDADQAVETIQAEGIEATFGFGAHWTAMRASPKYRADRFAIRKALVAGPPKFYGFVEEMCPPDSAILNLYAQTENGPLVTLTEIGNVDVELRRANSGRPLPGVQVKITDLDSGAPLPDGQRGRIWYRSPYLFLGYLQEDGSVRLPLDADGYFDSGDCGVMSGGYLTYTERLGGMVKSGGENVSLAKVADALAEVFKAEFLNVHAVAIPDPFWGDRVVAVARPKVPGHVSLADLKARCKDALAAYEIPRNLLEWDGPWPVSPEGKLGVKELTQFAVERVDVGQR